MPPTETVEKEIVLSQEVTQPVVTEVPKEKTPEEKEQARKAFERRQQAKNWKAELRRINEEGPTPEEAKAVEELAKKEGFDLSKPENKSHVDLMVKVNSAQNELRDRKRNGILAQASRDNLGATLEELEYEKGSDGFTAIGNHLFRKFGTENPDFYTDKDAVSKEIDSYQKAIQRKDKPVSPIEEHVAAKASTPKPESESRAGTQVADDAAKNKAYAEKHGLSEAKAPKILEKQQKLPSWARPKP